MQSSRTRIIIASDKMQQRYRYALSEPAGKKFHQEFTPDLTPKQMLELGVFGGRYMRDCRGEFPKDWFTRAKLHSEGTPGHSPSLNYFGVDASQPLSVWRAKGWLHPDDPRGWFQWYCRYYLGRRMEDDASQIKRWRMMRRHIAQIKKGCERGNLTCRKKQRQALLHWAYDSRKI